MVNTICLLFYPFFTWVDLDTYSEYIFGIRIRIHKVLNSDLIWIRIHNTGRSSVLRIRTTMMMWILNLGKMLHLIHHDLIRDWKAAKKWFKKKPFRYDLISDADPKCFIPDPAFEFSEFRIRIQSDPDPVRSGSRSNPNYLSIFGNYKKTP